MGFGRNSNSFKFLCMCLLPARMKKIQSKMNLLEWPQHFSYYLSLWEFYDLLKGSSARSPWSDLPQIRTLSRRYGCARYLKQRYFRSKMKALEWPQDDMLFFGAQRQITLRSVMGSGRNSNSFKFLCMCL